MTLESLAALPVDQEGDFFDELGSDAVEDEAYRVAVVLHIAAAEDGPARKAREVGVSCAEG